MSATGDWATALFKRSVLKQQKWRALTSLLGDTQGLRCLDIGGDNGVVSALLRRRGGTWTSADLDAQSVAAIRAVVGADVVQLTGGPLPFADGAFDRVVVMDGLEHVQDDAGFAREIARITKPGGEALFHVPLRKDSWLRRFRIGIGQTDEAHGHLRPGYTVEELAGVLGERYEIVAARTYSKFFSQAIDTVMTWAIRRAKRHAPAGGVKGTIVTPQDAAGAGRLFRAAGAVYPVLWAFSQLDRLLWFRSGYLLLVKATRR